MAVALNVALFGIYLIGQLNWDRDGRAYRPFCDREARLKTPGPTTEPVVPHHAVAIDTARGAAILLVVLYHVIGSGPASGLEQPPGSLLRIFADITNDIHMPIFAALAGYLYGMKPVAPQAIPGFIIGKLRRLAIPGAVAIALFLIAAQFVASAPDDARPLWQYAVYPYQHFWFLQAILVVFVLLVDTDAATRGRAGEIWFIAGIAMLLTHIRPFGDVLSINMAVWLLPYAALGILASRHRDRILGSWRPVLILLGLAAFAGGIAVDLLHASATGSVDPDHGAPHNLALSMGVVLLVLLLLPHLPWLAWLGPPSFVIYLYHPLFTSATRRLLHSLQIDAISLHLVAGTVIGALLPMALYLLARRWNLTRLLVLGLKPLQAQQEKPGATRSRAT